VLQRRGAKASSGFLVRYSQNDQPIIMASVLRSYTHVHAASTIGLADLLTWPVWKFLVMRKGNATAFYLLLGKSNSPWTQAFFNVL
jgi:hypothetical protein